jgi:2',3'-cyclic-nucleotide 2'-phosphodiesterase (5'-nucleotidase family)
VAVCHESVKKCAEWSRAAPEVNVFVSGHSHQALAVPEVVPETGAIIVQAGSYARWVGRLELEVDTVTRKVVRHEGRLVPMRHAEVPVDAEMLAWVQAKERELAPEASEFVFDNTAQIDGFTVARLAAEAMRGAAGADIGFCHPYQIIRDILPAGRVDVNAIFKTGGHRAHANVLVELTGAEVEAYVNALQFVQREPPEWAGFRARIEPVTTGGEYYRTDLEPTRRYRVVMAKLEWETRFLRLAEKIREREPANPLAACRAEPTPAPVSFTDAMCAYLRRAVTEGAVVQGRAEELLARRAL